MQLELASSPLSSSSLAAIAFGPRPSFRISRRGDPDAIQGMLAILHPYTDYSCIEAKTPNTSKINQTSALCRSGEIFLGSSPLA